MTGMILLKNYNKNKFAENFPRYFYLLSKLFSLLIKQVVFMMIVGLPKQGSTKKVCCPFCKWRLCDAVVDKPDYEITVINDYDSNLIIKCRKCSRLIGIALIFSKAENYI